VFPFGNFAFANASGTPRTRLFLERICRATNREITGGSNKGVKMSWR